jgi:hypothetical protein
MLVRMWWNRNPYTLLGGMQISTTTIESSMEIPQKTGGRTAIWSSDTIPGHLPKGTKTGYSTDTCTLMFITALFIRAKLWWQPRSPASDEWIKKLWYIYTMEYYSAIRNNDMWFEGKWMELEDIMLTEVSQVQKHKSCMFSLKNKHDHIQTQI